MSDTATTSRPWTDRQRAAFTTVGKSLLVSAAAGSGKTAVLAERCVYLVCDAPRPCDVGQLLVLTFTDSAAIEMKTRIKRALRRRIATNPSERLKRQADLVEHANVSTVHSFCARVLRQNFHRVGLDPNFRILDGDDAHLLRLETAGDLLQTRYESDDTGDFQRLVDAFAQGDEKKLIETVIDTHDLLCSLSAPEQWIERTLAEIRQAAAQPLAESDLGKQFIDMVDQALADLIRQCTDGSASIRRRGNVFEGYAAQLDELKSMIEHWRRVLKNDGLDMLIGEFSNQELPKAPTIRGDPPGKNAAKSILDSVKAEIQERSIYNLLALDSQQLQTDMAEVAVHAQAFLSLVTDFKSQYSQAKHDQRALDFSDLERLTLSVLGTKEGNSWRPTPEALAYHAQFEHVLVDEYQDINDIQDALLTLLSRECLPKAPGNLFGVGDVKQSIFRFRLADPRLFLERQKRFSQPGAAGAVIDLPDNFRSRAPLLEAINAVFSKLMTRQAVQIEYDDSHRLRPGRNYPQFPGVPCFPGAPIEFHLITQGPARSEDELKSGSEDDPESTRAETEAMLVARRIREITGMDGSPPMQVIRTVESGASRPEPIAFGDIVILLRAMKHKADDFAEILRAHGIPVHSEGGGFFDSTEIRDMLSLLRILDNQRQDIPLAALLRSPLSNLPTPDDAMARVRLACRDEAEPVPFHQAVLRYSVEQDDEWAAHLRGFFGHLAEWRDQANKRPAAELIWTIYRETGYLAYCSGLEDGRQRVANLLKLHQRAAQFSHFLRQGLSRFLRFLEALRQQQDLQRPSPAADARNVVRIMSIHRSKGLEFPVVFLPDLGKNHNLKDAYGLILADRTTGLGMQSIDVRQLSSHPSLCSTLVSQSLLRQTLCEELRLLYVAMTRAREHLICVGTCRATAIERWKDLWTNHRGPLPADVVLASRSPLDWFGPVWANTASTQPPVFDLVEHPAEEWQNWQNPRLSRPKFDAAQQSMAKLEPLSPSPEPSDMASEVIGRFEQVYNFPAGTRQPAALSVTAQSKESEIPAASEIPARKLDLPQFVSRSAAPKATDIGTATHRALELWDFSAGPSQIESLIERKLISSAEAALVDRQALAWFFGTDLARLLKERRDHVLREIPFALAENSQGESPSDPLDRTMIRGRIDLLIRMEDKSVAVVDYKTDRVSAADVPRRADSYRRQMEYYRQALATVAGAKISAIYLVFLTARIIEQL
ncbi:MAG: helicase-exonuclease AddAB subunit AddA [Tepidisphaeraceae bacterium]|jgi:ATP-dependent helicase/nuclease subunit A